jgi:hypothetical protein
MYLYHVLLVAIIYHGIIKKRTQQIIYREIRMPIYMNFFARNQGRATTLPCPKGSFSPGQPLASGSCMLLVFSQLMSARLIYFSMACGLLLGWLFGFQLVGLIYYGFSCTVTSTRFSVFKHNSEKKRTRSEFQPICNSLVNDESSHKCLCFN